ncbi:MAG: hypothetical protein HN337_04440 [Deltaproteobacteria bacterium]|jgi:hypothetical protein|nr:hypothetical protein [Deltaproteobacteria bacterium]
MFWYVVGAVFLVLLLGFMVGIFIIDRRYERKKTSETFSPGLRLEIEQEREEGLERHNKFKKAVERAKLAEDPDKTLQ